MKKILLKLFSIIFCNLLIFAILFLIFDYSIFYVNVYKDSLRNPKPKYTLFPQISFYEINRSFDFKTAKHKYERTKGRFPDGKEYWDKPPIIVFGCSYTFGYGLEQNQTFTHKLSHMLKRPVYNRGYMGEGPAFMLFQARESLSEFYNQVPQTDTYIYIMMNDHYRRNFIYQMDNTFPNSYQEPHFEYKNNSLEFDTLNKLFYKNSYLYLFFHNKFIKYYIENPKNKDKLIDLQIKFLTETRNALQTNLKRKIKFTVILYQVPPIMYSDTLKKKLKQHGFNVIDVNDLTEEKLDAPYYTISEEDVHPNEATWDLLTPLIIKELQKQNVI